MNVNSTNNFGTNNKPSNESNDEVLHPRNLSPTLTDAERTIAKSGAADLLAQVPPDAKSVETFKEPNIFNSGINLGRDNHVNFGLHSNVTVDGLAEASGTIGTESLSFTGAPFGKNDGSSYINIGSGRAIGGVTDKNGFPVANSPTDTREEGLNGVNIGAWTLSKPAETNYVDQQGNQKTVSANHATLGLNTDGTKVKDATGLDAGAGVVFGINGSEGTDKDGNQNSTDLELQLGFSGNAGVELGPIKAGASGQVLGSIGASVDVENPPNIAPESINNGVLPDQYSYNEQDQTITDWSSWFKDVTYPAENFDPKNPGTPSGEELVGAKEAAGRFTFDTLDTVGNGLIDAGSKVQEVSNETFAELEKVPERFMDSIKDAGNSFIDGIKNPRALFGSN